MRKSTVIIVIADVFVLAAVLLSYCLKKHAGYVICNWVTVILMIGFDIYSLMIMFTQRKLVFCIVQPLLCLFLFLSVKLYLPDRLALLVEVPKAERKIQEMKSEETTDEKMLVCDDYVLFEWEPGFLDYQWVLVYDEKDTLKDCKDSRKSISEGKLTVLCKAKKCFYLCVLYK